MAYVQRKFYFPEDLYISLSLQAKQEGLRIVDKLRIYTERGLREDRKRKGKNAAAGLLALAKLAEQERWGGDQLEEFTKDHDKYFVEAYETLKEGKKKV